MFADSYAIAMMLSEIEICHSRVCELDLGKAV
jgi:hypothetical protein